MAAFSWVDNLGNTLDRDSRSLTVLSNQVQRLVRISTHGEERRVSAAHARRFFRVYFSDSPLFVHYHPNGFNRGNILHRQKVCSSLAFLQVNDLCFSPVSVFRADLFKFITHHLSLLRR